MSAEVAYAGSSLAAVSCAEECCSPDTSAACYVEQNYSFEYAATFGPSELVERDAVFTAAIFADASKVLRSFNTWTFKREQPSNSQLMLRVVASAIASSKPIPFVLYWGKGPRQQVAAPDVQCLDFLAALSERVKSSYAPGAGIRLIFTDTHAELNGHPAECIKHYFDNVRLEAHRRGFDTCSLGKLVKMAGSDATATALEPSSVLLIPRPLFLKMLDSFPDSARRLRDAFAGRLNQSTREMFDLRTVLDAYERK